MAKFEKKTEEETTEVKKPRGKKKADKFDVGKYTVLARVETNGKVVEKEIPAPEFRNHRGKCRISAAKAYDVSIDHLEKAYIALNGKKIDGVYATDLIDRYGFVDGRNFNRASLAEKYNKNNIQPIDIAETKLKEIVSYDNVLKAYDELYIKPIKAEAEKEIEDAQLGE